MEARDSWRSLQAQLSCAKISLDAGDFAAALASTDAALAIDPACVAAQVLRDRIESQAQAQARKPSIEETPPTARPLPTVNAEGWARFEQRARQRRIERRIAAARTAIAQRQFAEARAAIAEIRELDDQCPDLASLDVLEAASRRSHRGPWLASATAFGAIVFAATSLEKTNVLLSYPFTLSALPLTALPEIWEFDDANSFVEVVGSSDELVRTGVADDLQRTAASRIEPREELGVLIPIASEVVPGPPINSPAPSTVVPSVPAIVTNALDEVSTQSLFTPAAVVPTVTTAVAAQATPAVAPQATPAQARAALVDDEDLVMRTLQRYRAAYSGLDAPSARQVWPTVNETALARAFDGLEAQELTFADCQVQLRGSAATATCTGSARHVPKVGNRQPRTEARVWHFALRRTTGGAWQIESARAE